MARGGEPLGNPANHFLFENDRVKVWHLELAPGESSDWHVHDMDYLTVVIEPGLLTRETEDGATEDLDLQLGGVNYTAGHGAHRVTNSGSTKYKNALIEIKKP